MSQHLMKNLLQIQLILRFEDNSEERVVTLVSSNEKKNKWGMPKKLEYIPPRRKKLTYGDNDVEIEARGDDFPGEMEKPVSSGSKGKWSKDTEILAVALNGINCSNNASPVKQNTSGDSTQTDCKSPYSGKADTSDNSEFKIKRCKIVHKKNPMQQPVVRMKSFRLQWKNGTECLREIKKYSTGLSS